MCEKNVNGILCDSENNNTLHYSDLFFINKTLYILKHGDKIKWDNK